METLTRPHSSTWESKGFKGLVAYAKCNRDSYDSELGFSFLLFSFSFRALYGLEVFKGKYFLGFLKVWGLGLKVLFLCCFRFRVYGFLGFRV